MDGVSSGQLDHHHARSKAPGNQQHTELIPVPEPACLCMRVKKTELGIFARGSSPGVKPGGQARRSSGGVKLAFCEPSTNSVLPMDSPPMIGRSKQSYPWTHVPFNGIICGHGTTKRACNGAEGRAVVSRGKLGRAMYASNQATQGYVWLQHM